MNERERPFENLLLFAYALSSMLLPSNLYNAKLGENCSSYTKKRLKKLCYALCFDRNISNGNQLVS